MLTSAQTELKTQETHHKHLLESLIAKRKQFEKTQTELQIVKDLQKTLHRERQKEDVQRVKDEDGNRDERTEDSIKDSEDEKQDLFQDPHREEMEEDAYDSQDPFKRIKDQMKGHKVKEERLIRLVLKADQIVLACAQKIERLKTLPKDNRLADKLNYKLILQVALECEHFITTQQSKINMHDFLMDNPDTLFQKFGKSNILVGRESYIERRRILRRRQTLTESYPF